MKRRQRIARAATDLSEGRPPDRSVGASRENIAGQRAQVARAAAALIVEQEIDDWQFARRKAARDLGIEQASAAQPDRGQLELALREYVETYLADEQAELLEHLRFEALDWMLELSEFDPVLTGFVAEGWAYPGCEIRLELRADDAKLVEIALLNRDIAFEFGPAHSSGSRRPEVLEIDGDNGPIRLVVQDDLHRRNRR